MTINNLGGSIVPNTQVNSIFEDMPKCKYVQNKKGLQYITVWHCNMCYSDLNHKSVKDLTFLYLRALTFDVNLYYSDIIKLLTAGKTMLIECELC